MVTRADHLTLEQMQSTDAQQELADEIKLRAEQSKDRTSAATSIIDREDVPKTEEAAQAEAPAEAPADEPAAAEKEAAETVTAETTPEGGSA